MDDDEIDKLLRELGLELPGVKDGGAGDEALPPDFDADEISELGWLKNHRDEEGL